MDLQGLYDGGLVRRAWLDSLVRDLSLIPGTTISGHSPHHITLVGHIWLSIPIIGYAANKPAVNQGGSPYHHR
jgi:hypothetical protein